MPHEILGLRLFLTLICNFRIFKGAANMAVGPSLKMKNRLMHLVTILAVTAFSALILRIGYLTVFQHSYFSTVASEQQLDDMTINANRGTIYDKNMKVLAQSATVWTVFISPLDIETDEERELIANGLSEILGVTKSSIKKKMKINNRYQEIKKKVEKEDVDKINEFKEENGITAVYTIQDTKRYYPYGSIASTVIGFTGSDNQGLYGIEAYYDDELQGTPGRIVSAVNANGTDMPFNYEKYYDPEDGDSLVLTIDASIQQFVEKALEQVVTEHKVQNRTCSIVMDVNTGEILAMATKPDFDLNEPFEIADGSVKKTLSKLSGKEYTTALAEAREAQWKNKAITELYEPGSVFKVVTGSAAIEEKAVSLNSKFTCSGAYSFGKGIAPIHCWKTSGHGTLDLTGAFVNSCNPAFIAIGQKLGATKFYSYLKSYGIIEKTGIDLPGESNSLTIAEDNYGIVELASASFGQSNKITPLQMITAYAAVVNGGYLVQPHVVSQRLDSSGSVLEKYEYTAKRQVISEETSATMREILEECVTANGGSSAYIAGYRIGGKSGTAEKLDDDDESVYVSSFVGFAPADDPQIAVLVMVDEPSAGEIYGSVVAAPAVASIMSDTLPYIGIEKSYTADELAEMDVTVPNVTNSSLTTAQNTLKNSDLNYKVIGSGSKVTKQVPSSGSSIPKDGTVILYTDKNPKEEKVTVPDLKGLSPSAANAQLTNLGLNIKFGNGAGENSDAKVSKQDIEAGKKVTKGTIITVTCVHVDEGG